MSERWHFVDLQGRELLPWLDRLGTLRIQVFREYPYLYDGTLEYERDYLQTYAKSSRSLVVLVVKEDGEVVGATTCLPLIDEGAEFQAPFVQAGIPLEDVCYFGESILLPEWRGQGIGKEFFRLREAHAKTLGLKWMAFCAVDRPASHPLRPRDYRELDAFWQSQAYVKRPDLQAEFVWKEIGEDEESPKGLTFWMKPCRD